MSHNQSEAESKREYVKVPNVVGLYRHTSSGRHYGCRKLNGKRREISLRTTDRKIAERKLRVWFANMHRIDSDKERITFDQLAGMFVAANAGKSKSTQTKHRSIIKELRRTSRFFHVEVRDIRPSHLDEWLALQEARLKNSSYNRYAGCLKQIFDIAVNDRIIAESPFAHVKTGWKTPQTPVRLIPTEEQFQKIVASIRSQRFTDHAEDSADFVEFLGLAGLGQAEASSLRWRDVDWSKQRFSVRRQKTGALFYVPIYPDLRPLLKRLQRDATKGSADLPVFAVKDAKKSLQAACERLGFPRFSQRSIRRFHIGKLWRRGVDHKLIAKWQGHRDGGKLIIDTYTEVFGDDDDEYEQQQLAKLAA